MAEPIEIRGLGKLGPVKVDPNADRAQAKIVRDALAGLLGHANRHEHPEVYHALATLGVSASDAMLAALGRLLK